MVRLGQRVSDRLTPKAVGLSERAIIDALHRAVVVTDAAGHIQLWNAAAEALYGWPEVEVVGRSIVEVLAPSEERGANQADLAFVAAGNVKTGDRVVVRRDGTPIRVHTFTRPVLDPEGNIVAIVGSSEDVTELRVTEQQARDLTEHFHAALTAGRLGTWRWDIATGTVVWDERLEALYGLEPGSFDGTFEMYRSLLHPEDREAVLATVHRAVTTRSSYRVEHRVIWADGSVHWIAGVGGVTVDEGGLVTGTVGCSMDVTERLEQEQQLQRLSLLAVEAAEREKLHRQRLEFLASINDALQAATTIEAIMRNVTAAAVPRLGDWCAMHLLPENGASAPDVEIAHVDPHMVAYARQLQERFPYDPAATNGVPRVIRTGATEFYPEITNDVLASLNLSDELQSVIAQLALRSSIIVPLIKRGRTLGAMQFVMSSSSRSYTSDDVTLAHTAAARIASSVENLRLHQRERTIAHTLQRSLLPNSLPAIPGIETVVRYWPTGEANEVGGDFYDVFPLDTDGQWAVVIGDVCGTGPAAAALTGLARHSIRDSAWHGDSPVDVLHSLHRAVLRSGSDSFLTAVYGTLDRAGPQTRLTIACGGHPLPVHVNARGSTTLGAPGTLLGLLPDVHVRAEAIDLEPGDVVVFYTDGATDLRPPHGLDAQRFAILVEKAVAAGGTADDVADAIHDGLDSVYAFADRNDDIALLVIRVLDQST